MSFATCRLQCSARLCASRFADGEVGHVGRARRVGRWFLEIGFRSFAQDLAAPSARSFAHESESQNTMQPARSFRAGFSQASARSFAHRIPHEITKASSLRETLMHLLLENQMSHSSHASHTSYPQAEGKARSTHHLTQQHQTKKGNKQ